LLSRQNSKTEESNENNWNVRRLKDIVEPYAVEVIQPRGFLSYRLVTCTELLMEQERLVDRYLRPLFYLLNDIMKWPFFLTFIPISSNQENEKHN
jgi:hypothetical protein